MVFERDRNKNKVERAICEIKRGAPLVLQDSANNYLLFAAVEVLEEKLFEQFKLISNNVYVILTSSKVEHITESEESGNRRLFVRDFSELVILITKPFQMSRIQEFISSRSIDEHVISLLKLSELLPYALVIDMLFKSYDEMQIWCKKNDVVFLSKSHLDEYSNSQDAHEVCRTPLFLKQTRNANIISYRACNGQNEHYAIIIDNPNCDEPLVRIHSACYTGDLLDSLSCDCRSQLHQTIQLMTDCGGGIILYLMQEGRGIGLINKLRAYSIQREYGLDTFDANKELGFDDDERDFTIAAKILKNLSIMKLQLVTNNSSKSSGLKNCGIEVTRNIPLIIEHNNYNYAYMKTKFDKLGHSRAD